MKGLGTEMLSTKEITLVCPVLGENGYNLILGQKG